MYKKSHHKEPKLSYKIAEINRGNVCPFGLLSFSAGATYFALNTWSICTIIGNVILTFGYSLSIVISPYLFIRSNYNDTLCNL